MKHEIFRNRLRKAVRQLILLLSVTFALLMFNALPAQAISAEWNGTTASTYAGGTGTSADPYLISTAEQLAYFSSHVYGHNQGCADLYFKLTQDILLNAMTDSYTFDPADPIKREFIPIGSGQKEFRGTFDGNGMKVIGLYINKPTLDNQGFFSITSTAMVMNVAVYGAITGKNNVGGIAGQTTGTIFRCSNYCTLTGNDNVGGIVGLANPLSSIRNCLNAGSVTGVNNVGGVAGNVDENNLEMGNNLNIGQIQGTTNVGGVAGLYESMSTSWNNYTTVSPATGSMTTPDGEDQSDDGGVFVGSSPTTEEWEEIIDNLNGIGDGYVDDYSNNEDGNDIWSPVVGGTPVIGVFLPSAMVAAGKYYIYNLVPDTTSLATTADSAFTVALRVNYSADTPLSTQTIGLKQGATAVTLPTDTTVIMLVDGNYYYKKLTADLAGSLTLNEFILMGTASTTYPSQTATANSTKQYVFIFDFSRTAAGIAAGTNNIEFQIAGGTTTGTALSVTVAGKNSYSLAAVGGTNSCVATFSQIPASGYDYITFGKSYLYEFYLQQSGSTYNLPVGTKVNGAAITLTGSYPYTFLTAAVGSGTTISIDMTDCSVPLAAGTYTMQLKVYASSDLATPRGGTLLTSGSADLTLTAPEKYAIRAIVGTPRVFDASPSAIAVPFAIQTLGNGAVKSTLQRKYGTTYSNVAGQVNQSVTVLSGAASLTLPAGSAKGTYRFILTKYNTLGIAKAKYIQNVIIK